MGTLEFSVFGAENDLAVLWSFPLIFSHHNLKGELGPAHLVIILDLMPGAPVF